MRLEEGDIKGLLEAIIAENQGRDISLGFLADETGSTRFARNAITTNGVYNRLSLHVEVRKGKKRGIAVIDELSKEKVREAVGRAETLAGVAPENPELMASLGPQVYPGVPPLYFPGTAEFSPGRRAEAIVAAIEKAGAKKAEAAGFFETGAHVSAGLTSKGLYYYFSSTRSYYSNTLRSGNGSGWAAAEEENADRMAPPELAERALAKALGSRNPRPFPAGKYTVVLEPAAVADLVLFTLYNFTAREADEGRSFLSVGEGKNRLGERLVSPGVTLSSDPAFPPVPAFPLGEDGLPLKKTVWIEKGVVKNLITTRYWAEKTGREPVPFPSNIIMEGEGHTLEDLIRSTDKGILVSRFWYIRDLNPMILLLTGLTRDGVFWIENGRIAHPVNNFRFNESPVNVLKNVQMMSQPVRAVGGETRESAFVPALKVKEFNFSSVSDAV
jgi:predicted Zn-dependent protease